MKCLAKSLSLLLNNPEIEKRFEEEFGECPWNAAMAIYIAHEFGVHLCLFAHDEGVYTQFDKLYRRYDGILLGDFPGKAVGHAVAKINGKLVHMDRPDEDQFEGMFLEMRGKLFLAKMN